MEESSFQNQEEGYNNGTSAPVYATSASSSLASIEMTSRLLAEIHQLQRTEKELRQELEQEKAKKSTALKMLKVGIEKKEEKKKELSRSESIDLEQRQNELKVIEKEIEKDREERVKVEKSRDEFEKKVNRLKLQDDGKSSVFVEKAGKLKEQHETAAQIIEAEGKAKSLLIDVIAKEEIQNEKRNQLLGIMEAEEGSEEEVKTSLKPGDETEEEKKCKF